MIEEKAMKESETVRTLLIGAGGYGAKIAADLLQNSASYGVRLVGVADPAFDSLPARDEFLSRGIPHFASPEEFFAREKADLAIVCTPIPLHESHVVLALENGCDVLCEKPVAALPEQALRMKEAAEKAKRHLNIGFQLSYTPSILELKKDVLSGVFGKPVRFSSLTLWPRSRAYYARSWCAKRLWHSLPAFDSIAMNACAHTLHLMFFLLGDSLSSSAFPEEAEMLLLRANDIETFDTSFFRIFSKGVELRFLASHTVREKQDPVVRLEFENAVVFVRHSAAPDAVSARFSDGAVLRYGSVADHIFDKIPYAAEVFRGRKEPVCTVDTALPQLVAVDAANRLAEPFVVKSPETVGDVVTVPGLEEIAKGSFESNQMPWEITKRFGDPARVIFRDRKGEKKA